MSDTILILATDPNDAEDVLDSTVVDVGGTQLLEFDNPSKSVHISLEYLNDGDE